MKPSEESMITFLKPGVNAISSAMVSEMNDLVVQAYRLGESAHFDDYCLMNMIRENVDNDNLSDYEFRIFVSGCIGIKK